MPFLYPGENNPSPSMNDIKWAFENRVILPKNADPYIETLRLEAFLKSCWNSSSIFSLSLEEAVFRQDLFVARICQLDWIHSPSLQTSVKRMIARYQNFLHMLKITKHKSTVLVPAIDINLVMYTHQLFPLRYYKTITSTTNCFLDYTCVKDASDPLLLTPTSQTYESIFSQTYLECMCWYCMATRKEASTVRNLLTTIKGSTSAPTNTPCENQLQQSCPWFQSHKTPRLCLFAKTI